MSHGFPEPPLSFLEKLTARASPVEPLELEGYRVWYVSDPALIREALLDNQKRLSRSGGPPRLARLLGQGLLRSSGEEHQRSRRLVQGAFVPSQMDRYAEGMRRVFESRLDGLSPNRPIDFHRFLIECTLAVVAETFFSRPKADVLGGALDRAIRLLPPGRTLIDEWWRARRFEAAVSKADEFLEACAKRDEEKSDLLGKLLQARDSDPSLELRDELMTLLIAGHETTASALCWAVYLLSGSPEEQRAIAADPKRARWTFAEALRLYPPAWILFRRVREPFVLGNRTLAPGSHILISPYALGRDPRWFEDPLEFRPTRWEWTEENPAFLPFGLGNRRCLGEAFAWREGRLFLEAFAKRWAWSLAPGAAVEPEPAFTLRPRQGLPLVLANSMPRAGAGARPVS